MSFWIFLADAILRLVTGSPQMLLADFDDFDLLISLNFSSVVIVTLTYDLQIGAIGNLYD